MTSKSIDFYAFVGDSKYSITRKTRGSDPRDFHYAELPAISVDTTTMHWDDIDLTEHTGRFSFEVDSATDHVTRYTEIGPVFGDLGDSSMKVMLETDSIVTADWAISYGFYDAGHDRHHQCYAYVTRSHESWMRDLLQDPAHASLRDAPFHLFALPGSHDAGMYLLGAGGDELFEAAKQESLGMELTLREVMNMALTQKETITAQLQLGARFFDFRPGHHYFDPSSELCHQHGVIPGCTLRSFLEQVMRFLVLHPFEIVVVCFSTSGFKRPEMEPRADEVPQMVKDVFAGSGIEPGQFAEEVHKPYKKLLALQRRFLVAEDYDLSSTYDEAAYTSTDPLTVIASLDERVQKGGLAQDCAHLVWLQGTASGLAEEQARGLSFSDASSPLLYTKARFDHRLYPWIVKNQSAFPNDQTLVFCNDFFDNVLTENCIAITRERVALYKKRHEQHKRLAWLRVSGDSVWGPGEKIPDTDKQNSIELRKIPAPFPQPALLIMTGVELQDEDDCLAIVIKNETAHARNVVLGNRKPDRRAPDNDIWGGGSAAFGKWSSTVQPSREVTTIVPRRPCEIDIYTDRREPIARDPQGPRSRFHMRHMVFESDFSKGDDTRELIVLMKAAFSSTLDYHHRDALDDSNWFSKVRLYDDSRIEPRQWDYDVDFKIGHFAICEVHCSNNGTYAKAVVTLQITLRDVTAASA